LAGELPLPLLPERGGNSAYDHDQTDWQASEQRSFRHGSLSITLDEASIQNNPMLK
jgi:hypothetical protein